MTTGKPPPDARDNIVSEFSSVSFNRPVIGISPSSTTVVAGPQHDERLMKCLQYSRAVRVLAVLSAVVLICGASAFKPLILMLWGPIAGYVASTFKLRAAYAFLFYYSLWVSWDIGWLISGGKTWIVVWVFLFTDAASLGLVCVYARVLRTCTPAEVQRLRDPQTSWMSGFFPLSTLLARGRASSTSTPDDVAVL